MALDERGIDHRIDGARKEGHGHPVAVPGLDHREEPAVPYAAHEMRRRGYDDDAIDQVFYRNPVKFLSQCPNFTVR